jgi:AcrR family transcriptional regulator
MRPTAKLSGEERRAAIIKAVRQVFAEKGFDGTTTRELAEAAGVSEALLFRHFPSKAALFAAMQLSCCSEQDQGLFNRLRALEPSASTLILMVHFLVSRVLGGCTSRTGDVAIQNRLILRSLAEEGEFARLLLGRLVGEDWVPKVEECLTAAAAAGDAVEGPVLPRVSGWFAHHLAMMILFYSLPSTPVVDHGVSRDALVEQAVWFTLRGMGLKEQVIRTHYNPSALTLFAG